MDSVRYYLALLLVIAIPGAFLFWFSVHPSIGFWRKLGPALTFTIHYTLIGMVAAGLFLVRKPLLAADFGTNPVLITLAIPIYLLAVVVAWQRRKQLGWKAVVGLPELASGRYESRLVTQGIYSRIRHPRYVEMLLFILGHALFTNYLAAYIVFFLSLPWVVLVVRLEERELRNRFGEDYERYRQRVPRGSKRPARGHTGFLRLAE